MPRRDRRLEKAIRNPKDISFQELCRLYEAHGFVVDSGKGSHFLAKLPGTPIKRTFPRQNPMKVIYVKAAIEAIEEAELLKSTDEE